jgi:putative secretion ATPase (PEP-CTERM system associated)
MYESFYGLKKKPFQLSPDPEFFFNSAVHKRALAYLRYGLAQGEGFIVVTGAPGTGKTMLAKELFENIRHENVVAGLMVSSQVGAEDTLRIIAAAFGLAYDAYAKAILLKNLENYFKLKASEGKRVLLVVDEAQNLPQQSLEELRMLLNFELGGRPTFQVFMLGQEELRNVLQADDMEQVRQRITATYHLRPLDREETRDYIIHRLTTAGWSNDPIFQDDVFDEIFRFTGGTPRIINSVCDRLLLYGYLEELHQFDDQATKLVIHEIEQDTTYPKTESRTDTGRSTHNAINNNATPSRMAKDDGMLYASDIDGRLLRMEGEVAEIKRIIQKERALLRKAVLIQLDMTDVYDADGSQ